MFKEKISATIGPSYVASFFIGGLLGLEKLYKSMFVCPTEFGKCVYKKDHSKSYPP